jgi:hypothetical protein
MHRHPVGGSEEGFALTVPAPAFFADEPERAARMPARIRVGLGGQPGTATSTGMTFDTRPQLA